MKSGKPYQCLGAAALCATIALGVTLATAQDKSATTASVTPAAASKPSGRHPVAELLMAEQLARYGDQMQDPLALIAAARIKQQLGPRLAKREFKSGDGQGAAPAAGRPDSSVPALLARARTVAKGRADIIALANETESARPRGRVDGPHLTTAVIRGGVTNTLAMEFEGGTLSVVGISGDGATDLDLFVFDANGKRICAAASASDDEICRFTPPATGSYRIEVKNLGKVANQYLFVSN